LLDSLEFAEKQVFKSTKEIRRFCQTDPELSQCSDVEGAAKKLNFRTWRSWRLGASKSPRSRLATSENLRKTRTGIALAQLPTQKPDVSF
jgi:hypothetical protein